MMKKTVLVALLAMLAVFVIGSSRFLTEAEQAGPKGNSGTIEKLIVAGGNAALDIDLNKLNGGASKNKGANSEGLRFDLERNSFFTIVAFNGELRGALPSSMSILPQDSAVLPAKLESSYQNLVIESTPWGEPYELVVRDSKTGFTFFNIEGHIFEYDATQNLLNVSTGRVLLSKELAEEMGRPSEAGTILGNISISANMRPIEVTQVVDGEVKSETLPPSGDQAGTVPGPDVVVGDVNGLAQFGSSSGTKVGLALGTDSCNFGTVDLNWFQLPDNDHPVIPQNLYRMSGGATNDERFEQIAQSNVKHAFTALTQNLCGLGCNGVGGTRLGSGCSDPYVASLNAGPNLGSRAWINPFTGFFPRGDSATPPNVHTGHTHTGPSHRILTEINDLSTTLNVGATYYAEGQYITPHEYTWCQSNPTQCNMYNNVSFRRYNVTGTNSPFSFTPVGTTQREKAALNAWTGATLVEFRPAPGVDGQGIVGYKVTNPSPGVWHYEYAVYNQNLDRGIQSFSIPIGNGVTLTNVGFYAPANHPGWTGDGTFNNAGFSNAAWAQSQTGGAMTWSSETLAQNQNANAIRWGTMYNFRFDSNRPPQAMNATIGFYKTGSPMNIAVQGPSPATATNASVTGRVLTSDGLGVANAVVTISSAGGTPVSVTTGSLGVYRFTGLTAGASYTISVTSKRYNYTSQTLQINGDLTGVNFTPN